MLVRSTKGSEWAHSAVEMLSLKAFFSEIWCARVINHEN